MQGGHSYDSQNTVEERATFMANPLSPVAPFASAFQTPNSS